MARLALNHPNRKRLLAWLHDATARGDVASEATASVEAVTKHVEQCERCANRLEELSSLDAPDDAGDVGLRSEISGAMRELYQPPANITDRVLLAIDERKRATEELNLFLGLFTIASDAAGLMLPGEKTSGSDSIDETGREGEDRQ